MTPAAVSASQPSLASAVIGVDQVTIIWMEETLRAVPNVFAMGIQPAAKALGTIVSTESPLPLIKMLMVGKLSREMDPLQSSSGHPVIMTYLAQHDDQTLSTLWLLPNFLGINR